jgi:hypothetical protein
MKNFEKWEKEVMQIVIQNKPIAVVNNKPCVCDPQCSQCRFNKNNGDMRGCIVKGFEWLYEEYKEPIKLSRLEYELLKYYIEHGYQYIARDNGKALFAYDTKPRKIPCQWWTTEKIKGIYFDECFKFVKWEDEEPTLIQDILDEYEVIEDVD